jgi:hypothetical protein
VLGIGKRPKLDWLEIKWPQPSGATERFTDLPIDRYITIVSNPIFKLSNRKTVPSSTVLTFRRRAISGRVGHALGRS